MLSHSISAIRRVLTIEKEREESSFFFFFSPKKGDLEEGDDGAHEGGHGGVDLGGTGSIRHFWGAIGFAVRCGFVCVTRTSASFACKNACCLFGSSCGVAQQITDATNIKQGVGRHGEHEDGEAEKLSLHDLFGSGRKRWVIRGGRQINNNKIGCARKRNIKWAPGDKNLLVWVATSAHNAQ